MKKSVNLFITILISILSIFGITFSVKALNVEKLNGDKQIKQMNILNNDTTATYSYTYDNLDVYVDAQQTEYLVKNDMTFGFIKKLENPNFSKSSIMTQEQALVIGKKFINSRISNLYDYTLSSSTFNSDYREYSFVFTKKLLNYDTMDLIFIAVSSNGEVSAFYSVNAGEFDSYNSINLDENDIINFINKKINNTYFNQVENIRELGRTFKKENNELVLEIVVEVSLKDGTIVADSLIYHI